MALERQLYRPVIGKQWWLNGGVHPTHVLAAFQPFGQQNMETSLFNINSMGTNNAAIGTTPAFSKDGWTFTAASSQYLTVGSGALATAVPISMVCLFQADNITSAYPLMSISRAAATNEQWVLEAGGATSNDPVRAVSTANGTVKAAVSSVGYVADKWYVGAAVFVSAASRFAYIFSKDNMRTARVHYGNFGAETTSNTPSTSIDTTSIGYTSDASTPTYHGGKIGACALYKVALSQGQVTEIALGLLELVGF